MLTPVDNTSMSIILTGQSLTERSVNVIINKDEK